MRIKRYPKDKCLTTTLLGKFRYIFVTLSAFLVTAGYINPVSAERREAAELSLLVTPPEVAVNGNVDISTDITAESPINVGMLIYRLVGEDGKAKYLTPIIIHDFKPGDSRKTEKMSYTVGSEPGNLNIEAYLCIGQCAIKGENLPRNAAAAASVSLKVIESTGGTGPLQQPLGPLQFPQ